MTRRAFLGAALRIASVLALAGRARLIDAEGAPRILAAPRPRGLCFLPDGTLYVTALDPGVGYALLRASPDGGKVDSLLPRAGLEAGPLNFPTRIARFNDETLAITETNRCRIRLFGLDGTPGRVVGGPGFTPGLFHYPLGLAAGGGLLHVADTGNHRVQVVDKFGQPELAIGMLGDEPGRFRRPRDVVRAADGTLYVLDDGHSAVKVFDGEGRWRRTIDLAEGGAALALDEDRGMLCVAAPEHRRVRVLDLQGKERSRLDDAAAAALAFHPDGRIAAADPEGGRVVFYEIR